MNEPARSISTEARARPVTLTWSEDLGKRVRTGDWPDQAIATTTKIAEAIDGGHWELAAQLVDYFMEEAKVCHAIYSVWSEGFILWLTAQGVPESTIAAEHDRLRALLAFPDGEPFDPATRWPALGRCAGELGNQLRGLEIDAAQAHTPLEQLREDWRRLHDRWVDYQFGLLTFVTHRFGEASLEKCYRHVLEPYLEERYQPFDLSGQAYEDTLYRNLYLSFEAMRGHLVGHDRRGGIEFEETDDAWILRFDPCGSGNRAMRGDPIEGTGSRAEPPYRFGVTQEEYDWAWNEKGICYYCAHCCLALELWPAEQSGHPVRIVDSPRWPQDFGDQPAKCTWTIYKSIEAIPAWAYERIGKAKPEPAEQQEAQ